MYDKLSNSDDGCNIAVESFQTLCLFRVNRSCYIHPSEYLTLFELLSKKIAIDTASTKRRGVPSIHYSS